ncbi:MAG: hypothetical protein ACE5FU_07900 [Nitrospinota bacterium]
MRHVLCTQDYEESGVDIKEWCSRHSGDIGLAVLIIYVILLGFGTVGEIFDVEWILKFPLFNF